jgi:hypothetical protein
MQKIINVLALASTAVSVAVVGSGIYVYVNRTSIIDGVKSQVMEAVTGSLGGLGGLGGGSSLPIGTPDLAAPSDQASIAPSPSPAGLGLPAPNSPF